MTHEMNLQHAPFIAIQKGFKRIEMRLWDEKRQLLSVEDLIRFTDIQSGETLVCQVIGLHRFPDFPSLYQQFDKIALGYQETEPANPDDMLVYYPKERVAKYGVVGIEIKINK